MNKGIRDLIIFTGGLIVGAASSWVICKKYYSDKAEEEIASVERAFSDRLDEIEEEKNGALDVAKKAILSANDYNKEDPGSRELISNRSTLDGIVKSKNVERIDYTKYSEGDIIRVSDPPKNSVESIAVDDHPRDDGEDESMESPEDAEVDYEYSHARIEIGNGRDNLRDPYEITYDEYGSLPSFEPKELYFYDGDGTMVEGEHEEIIDNYEYLVGDVLAKTGFRSSDLDRIYIRNEHVGCDYEVIRVKGTYDFT